MVGEKPGVQALFSLSTTCLLAFGFNFQRRFSHGGREGAGRVRYEKLRLRLFLILFVFCVFDLLDFCVSSLGSDSIKNSKFGGQLLLCLPVLIFSSSGFFLVLLF